MKRLIFIIIVLLSFTSYSQNNNNNNNNNNNSPSFEEVLMPYVQKALDMAETGVEFMVDEVPDVIRQYLYYNAVIEWLTVLLGLFFILIGPIIITRVATVSEEIADVDKSYYKQVKKGRWLRTMSSDLTFQEAIYYIGKGASYIAGTLVVLTNLSDAIKVTFFPKLYLLETFIHLIR